MIRPAKTLAWCWASGRPPTISKRVSNANGATPATVMNQALKTNSRLSGDRLLSRSSLYMKYMLKNVATGPRTTLTNPARPADFAAAAPFVAVASRAAASVAVVIAGSAAKTPSENACVGPLARSIVSTSNMRCRNAYTVCVCESSRLFRNLLVIARA